MQKFIFLLLCLLCFSSLTQAAPIWNGEEDAGKQCPETLDATVMLAGGWSVAEGTDVSAGATSALTHRLLSEQARKPACRYDSDTILRSTTNVCAADGIIAVEDPEASIKHICLYPSRGITITSQDVNVDWESVTLNDIHTHVNGLCEGRNFLTYTVGDADAYVDFAVAENGVMTVTIKCSSTRKNAPATGAAIRTMYANNF